MQPEKRYVVRLTFREWLDNLYLAGPGGPEQDAVFADCLRALGAIENRSPDLSSYRRDAIHLFEEHGFYQIKK